MHFTCGSPNLLLHFLFLAVLMLTEVLSSYAWERSSPRR